METVGAAVATQDDDRRGAAPPDYDRDVAAWATEQARLLRAGQFDRLDIEHIADEIEDVGKSERRELASRMSVLLAHLLTRRFQPTLRGGSWERTIREQRKQVARKLRETPSLAPLLKNPDWLDGVWGDAVTQAVGETGLSAFPETCPWTMDEVLREGWTPA